MQSVFNKLNELAAYAAEENPDFILLTETWCNDTINNAALSLPGYQLETDLRKDRENTSNGIGGGLLVYTRDGIKVTTCKQLENYKLLQYCAFSIITDNEPVNMVLVYRPPNSDKCDTDELCKLIRNLPKSTILIGDINFPKIDWSGDGGGGGGGGGAFFSAAQDSNLEQLVHFPTHKKGNTLDLILTNMPNNILAVSSNPPLGKSDHCVILTEILLPSLAKKNKRKVENWAKVDEKAMLNHIGQMDWDIVIQQNNVESAWQIFKKYIRDTVKLFVPLSTARAPKDPKWLTREIVRLTRKKKRAWKTYTQHFSTENRIKYEELSKELVRKVRNAKRNQERKLANSNDGNAKRFAAYIKSKTKTVTSIGPLKHEDGSLITEDIDMAEMLNTFFASVFTQEETDTVPELEPETGSLLTTIEISEDKVKNKIKDLKDGGAQGPDEIGAKILKLAAQHLVKPLCHIYRLSLRTGEVPKDWRHARVTPIYKKGPKGEAGNYRPVSLTSIPCRILESLIKDDLMKHLLERKLITDNQHGFMTGRSCTTNLISFMNKLTEIVDSGDSADVFYLDFAKAFDKVPKLRLLAKLEAKGIQGQILKWIEAWLTDRTQTVRVGTAESTCSAVESGVPQGSVLGPPLFNIFIDDIDNEASQVDMIKKFADDTKGLKVVKNVQDRDSLQNTLDNLARWAKDWGMKFNIPKCKIMHVGLRNPSYKYRMEGIELQEVTEEKDIGILVHQSLRPSKHCKKAADMAGAVLKQITKNFHFRDRNIFKKLYVQYVRPHVEFASPVWSPWLEQDIQTLEKVQKKAVGMISGLKGENYIEKCKELKLDTLRLRRDKQDLQEMFKIIKGTGSLNPEDLFRKPETRTGVATRSADDPHFLKIPKTKLEIRKNSFTVRIIDKWNALPHEMKSLEKIHQFKRALNNYLG